MYGFRCCWCAVKTWDLKVGCSFFCLSSVFRETISKKSKHKSTLIEINCLEPKFYCLNRPTGWDFVDLPRIYGMQIRPTRQKTHSRSVKNRRMITISRRKVKKQHAKPLGCIVLSHSKCKRRNYRKISKGLKVCGREWWCAIQFNSVYAIWRKSTKYSSCSSYNQQTLYFRIHLHHNESLYRIYA